MAKLRTFQAMSTDDPKLFRLISDVSGGVNTRVEASKITDTQATQLNNVELNTPGQRSKRLGFDAVANDVSNVAIRDIGNYVRQSLQDYLVLSNASNIYAWKYNDAALTDIGNQANTTYVTTTLMKESGLTPDDVIMLQNGTDNAQRIHINSAGAVDIQDLGDTNTSPEKTLVNCWYNNRWWTLKDDKLGFSDAYDEDYSGAFDRTTNWYRMNVGEERALVATRDLGIVALGREAVWALAPSVTPVATDLVQPLCQYGCAAGKTACQVGDDIMWLSQDGVRALKRTVQDKLQTGDSKPLSYVLKDEFDIINWTYIDKACAVYFDNRYLLALPTGTSTYNNKVWVYYPASQAWVTWDMNVGSWSVHTVNGKQRLYFGDSNNGQMYEMFNGLTDDGTAISYSEKTRAEDFQQRLTKKVGGWIEIEAGSTGENNTLTVSCAIDGGELSTLGTIDLYSGTTPTLPVALPFQLADNYVVREKLHLDNLGTFRTIQVKVENSDTNTEEVVIYSINIVTFNEEAEDE
jgi:hypothetical protein